MLKEEVDDEDIAEVISRWTGIPVSRKCSKGEREKLVQMEQRLAQRRDRSGSWPSKPSPMPCAARVRAFRTPNRPIGSFIFMGPTGVGKTELAKALAEFIFRRRAGHRAHRHE
jgi:ATP-dependent Clp protease ATP-binding subunit ClpB